MTFREHLIVSRWQALRENRVAPEDRIKDLDQYEAELDAIRREMAPIRAAIERTR